MFGCHLEIVVAEQEPGLVAQRLVDRQDAVVARDVAVDDVAQGHDEAQILAVQDGDGRAHLIEAVGVVAAERGVGRRLGILRIGDHAEAQRPVGGSGSGSKERGAGGEDGAAGQHAASRHR